MIKKDQNNITICPLLENHSYNKYSFYLKKILKKGNVEKNYRKYIQKTMNADEEEKFLTNILLFLSSSNEVDIIAEKIYSDLLKGKENLTLINLKFLINYTVYKKYCEIKYDNDGNVRKGYEKFNFPELSLNFDINTNNLGYFTLNDGIPSIAIKYYDYLEKAMLSGNVHLVALYNIIQTINHEMTHYKQEYELNSSMLTKSSFNMLKHYIAYNKFATKDFDEYEVNYKFKEIETEAEFNAYIDTIKIIKKYIPDEKKLIEFYEKKKDSILDEESISYQELNNQEYYLRDEYNLKSMISALKEDKSILERYPQLQYFFDKEGLLKSEIDLLKGFSQCDNDTREIYYEFFTYIYGLGDYRDVTNNLSEDLMEVKFNIIKKLLKQEVNYYKVLDSLDDDPNRIFERTNFMFVDYFNEEVMKIRKERVSNYNLFLQAYKVEMKSNDSFKTTIGEIDSYIELTENILCLNKIFVDEIKNNLSNKDESITTNFDFSEKKQIINSISSNMYTSDDNVLQDEYFTPSNRHL